ncbi:MAG: hypothetical protein R3C05_29610, partial [Pirellulaceae bacterium]
MLWVQLLKRSLFCLLLLTIPQVCAAATVSLDAAAKAGSVSVRFEFLGGAMGDRMKVFVRKQTAGDMTLKVVPGTLFLPQGGDVQRLAAVQLKGELTTSGTYRRANQVTLRSGDERGLLIEV